MYATIVNLMVVDAPVEASSHFPYSAVGILILGFLAAAGVGSYAWFKSKRPIGWKQDRQDQPTGTADKPAARYDRGIIPSETAARQEREGQIYKETPQPEGSPDTTSGYTVDREGLLNNYAVEPEMYVEEPGDLRQEQAARREERARELEQINQSGGKGPGVI